MNIEELLRELSVKINSGEISKTEVMSRLRIESAQTKTENKNNKGLFHFSMTKMLYVLGAAIVVNWHNNSCRANLGRSRGFGTHSYYLWFGLAICDFGFGFAQAKAE